jgi:hypothetical protein
MPTNPFEPPKEPNRPSSGGRVELQPSKGAGNTRSRRRRTYVHNNCGGQTIVSGDEFGRVANPFTLVSQTYCSSCSSFDSLSSFSWADTGENIGDYRQRQRDKAPLSLSCGVWLGGPLLFAAPFALVGYFCVSTLGPLAALAGAIGAVVFFVAFLVPYVTQWIWGIDYRREE